MPRLADKATYIFRTFVPQKEWLAGKERAGKGAPISKETQKQFLQIQQELGLDQYDFGFDVELDKSATPGW